MYVCIYIPGQTYPWMSHSLQSLQVYSLVITVSIPHASQSSGKY